MKMNLKKKEKYKKLVQKQKKTLTLINELNSFDDSVEIPDSPTNSSATLKRKLPSSPVNATVIRPIKRKKNEIISEPPKMVIQEPIISAPVIQDEPIIVTPKLPEPMVENEEEEEIQNNSFGFNEDLEEVDQFEEIGEEIPISSKLENNLNIEDILNNFSGKEIDLNEANEISKQFWNKNSPQELKQIINETLKYIQRNISQNYFSNSLKMFSFIQINSPKVILNI
jgi:hypothetical protein